MQQQNVLGLREFLAISLIMVALKLTDNTPVIVFQKLGTSAWMSPILSGIVIAIPIFCIVSVVCKYEDKSLFQILNHLFGKYIGWLVVFYLWLSLLFILIVDSAIYTDLISTMYFPNTPSLAIYGVLMVISAYGAYKGIFAIGSTAWAIFPYVTIALTVFTIATIGHGESYFLFPIFGSGEWNTIKESVSGSLLYNDFIYMGILASLLPTKKTFKKGIWLTLGIAIFEITFAMISFIMLFDYKSVQLLNYPWHEAIRNISFGFLTNVETLFFPFWITTVFIRFAVYLNLVIVKFGHLFKIQNFHPLAPIFAVLIVFIGMIPDQPSFTLPMLQEKFILFIVPMTIALPILLWIVSKFKGDPKHETNKV